MLLEGDWFVVVWRRRWELISYDFMETYCMAVVYVFLVDLYCVIHVFCERDICCEMSIEFVKVHGHLMMN